jgi:hypothetical protein
MAANVFASMLGVASTSPNYPTDQPSVQPPANQPPAVPQSPDSYAQPYQQASRPGSSYAQGNINQAGSAYQLNSANQLGQAPSPYSSLTNIPNPGAIPQSPAQPGGMYDGGQGQMQNQGYGMGALGDGRMSGAYGGMQAGNMANQNNTAMGGMSQYPGNANAMGNPAPQPPAFHAEAQKNNKKRGGIFDAIREWLSR